MIRVCFAIGRIVPVFENFKVAVASLPVVEDDDANAMDTSSSLAGRRSCHGPRAVFCLCHHSTIVAYDDPRDGHFITVTMVSSLGRRSSEGGSHLGFLFLGPSSFGGPRWPDSSPSVSLFLFAGVDNRSEVASASANRLAGRGRFADPAAAAAGGDIAAFGGPDIEIYDSAGSALCTCGVGCRPGDDRIISEKT